MNSNKKKMTKIIAGILLILAIPVLFFQLMGGSLLNMKGPQKRMIAIVNEDLGDAKDEESIEMGKEVVSILAEDSSYEWKVMGRGAAVNGLKSNQYEAIIYIPSDFSENVMSYDQENPEKAEFTYEVQRQKDSSKKEKVLHEIEAATSRVNQKISTLYWSYVALEMDHIKNEFINILEKETEFLDAMSTYYKPGSETMAEEMKKQKELVEELRSTIGDVNGAHDARIENVDSFGQQLEGFVTYVEHYKDFQGKQKEILLHVQDSSLEKIQATAATQMKQFNDSVIALEKNNEKLNSEIQKVNETIDGNKEKFNNLSALRQQQVDRQLKDLLTVQGTAIDRYNDSILKNLKKGIADGKDGSAQPEAGDGLPNQETIKALKEEMERKAKEKSEATPIGLAEEQEKVNGILSALAALKAKVEETEPDSEFVAELTQLEVELGAVTDSMSSKSGLWSGTAKADADDYSTASTNYGSLYGNYASLHGEYKSVQQILKNHSADTARLLVEIKEKESALLQHEALTADKKKELEELFSQGIASSETEALLAYYATLQQFGFTLDERGQGAHRDEILKDEILTTLLENVVSISEDELEGWKSVEGGIPETQMGMSDLGSTFAAIMSGYEETVQEQHTALLADLHSIDEQANVLLAQIQTPSNMIPSGEPVSTVGEGEVMAGQQNVGTQLVSLSSLVKSLSERQDGIVNYASDLHGKANNLKATSTVFSDKWQSNVEAMSMFQEDIQEFLANTYVDGQENGYVFNHLVTPLQVKGEAAVTDEVKKVPPVILFIILLISSLLIGFFSHTFKQGSIGLRLGMIGLLSVLVGLIISLYSVNMYILRDDRAIEWTIFTVLLLLAGAAVIRTALDVGQTVGWIASIVLMCLYISPLLILGVPEIAIPDVLSKVFISIKYEPDTLFGWGASIAGMIAIVMLAISYFINRDKVIETAVEE
ncbi:type VII secretion protein EsaA [Sporosarcina sp. FSL K6-1522]|uniref:type VII secretion protein EsaA n=1 Tax=Sporosarcina sp. FSL K6-1522 TaxID=2921554 RepID=UPI00315B2475